MLPLILLQLAFAVPQSDSTLEMENAWVRIVRVHYLPHEKTRAHDHPATPTVYVYTTDGGRLRIVHDESEKPVIRPLVKAGAVRFNHGAAEHHQVEELDGIASEYLRLELKIAPIDLPSDDIRRAPDDRTPYENADAANRPRHLRAALGMSRVRSSREPRGGCIGEEVPMAGSQRPAHRKFIPAPAGAGPNRVKIQPAGCILTHALMTLLKKSWRGPAESF